MRLPNFMLLIIIIVVVVWFYCLSSVSPIVNNCHQVMGLRKQTPFGLSLGVGREKWFAGDVMSRWQPAFYPSTPLLPPLKHYGPEQSKRRKKPSNNSFSHGQGSEQGKQAEQVSAASERANWWVIGPVIISEFFIFLDYSGEEEKRGRN